MNEVDNSVTRWFGPQFGKLHPLLQELHREGGTLRGIVAIDLGRGIARPIGRRLAGRLGVPIDKPERGFEVEIRHTGNALLWKRRFDDGHRMTSMFRPVGAWPNGHWAEETGALRMQLTVDVLDGGWHWRVQSIGIGRIRLPVWTFPRLRAHKRIKHGKYDFSVEVALPVLGPVLRYAGELELDVGHARHAAPAE